MRTLWLVPLLLLASCQEVIIPAATTVVMAPEAIAAVMFMGVTSTNSGKGVGPPRKYLEDSTCTSKCDPVYLKVSPYYAVKRDWGSWQWSCLHSCRRASGYESYLDCIISADPATIRNETCESLLKR